MTEVSKEHLLEIANKLPDGALIQISGNSYFDLLKAAGLYKEPEPIVYPPDNITPCPVNGIHMWGFRSCRHCDQLWPEEYRK